MIPYSRPKLSDLYTLSQSKLLENHTLHSGTYLYSPYMAVPPPGSRWTSQVCSQTGACLVFGQHLVTETVLKAIVGHLNNKSPNKALALSFNGWTGSGKTLLARSSQSIFLGRGRTVNLSIKSLPPTTSHTSPIWNLINDICVVWFLVQC